MFMGSWKHGPFFLFAIGTTTIMQRNLTKIGGYFYE